MLHIRLKGKGCRTLCKFDLLHTPDLLGWLKKTVIEIVEISTILLKTSELIVFGYDLSDTQDGLRCLYFVVNILCLSQEFHNFISNACPPYPGAPVHKMVITPQILLFSAIRDSQ